MRLNYCHLYHRTSSASPDKFAFSHLSVLVWDPPGTNFMISQHIEANIQLPGCILHRWVDQGAFHSVDWQQYRADLNVACHTYLCCHYWNTLSTTLLCLHSLCGLHKHSTCINECQWVQFPPLPPTCRNSITHHFFACTFMSNAILTLQFCYL